LSSPTITAIIVTYNRKKLLERCLSAITTQTRRPDAVLVIDNASTDGTPAWLHKWMPLHLPQATLIALDQNTGGAGGFAAGMKLAFENGAEWVWMMDDDAEPHPEALEQLMRVATDPSHVYGSLAVCGDETSWLTTVLNPPLGEVERPEDVPEHAEVQSLPFLGFLIHRDLVARIGLPDTGYFIAADDVEYCVRAQHAGAKIIMASRSRIEHPKSRPYKVKVLGRTLTCLALPPWKRYYDTRNRLLIARRHYGIKLFTQTIPGSLVRLFAALWQEPDRPAQLRAFCAGFWDGLWGIKGKRHEKWGIK
jgi:rhamnopyranosyl-N-acetylglucosaminyl-diphospho-decaprenol beta-1,3/1,4-galactofuranosyltransferase